MKKGFSKILTIVAVFALMIPAFALAGCTDNKNKTRTLNSEELDLVGTWKNPENNNYYIFNNDGTYGTRAGQNEGKFTFSGTAMYFGRQYIIFSLNDNYAFARFGDDYNKLYPLEYDNPVFDNFYIRVNETTEKVLNKIEQQIIGTWRKDNDIKITFKLNGTYQIFNPNGDLYDEGTFNGDTVPKDTQNHGQYYDVRLDPQNGNSSEYLAFFPNTDTLHQVAWGIIGYDKDTSYYRQ